jgi:hypothetical protein
MPSTDDAHDSAISNDQASKALDSLDGGDLQGSVFRSFAEDGWRAGRTTFSNGAGTVHHLLVQRKSYENPRYLVRGVETTADAALRGSLS